MVVAFRTIPVASAPPVVTATTTVVGLEAVTTTVVATTSVVTATVVTGFPRGIAAWLTAHVAFCSEREVGIVALGAAPVATVSPVVTTAPTVVGLEAVAAATAVVTTTSTVVGLEAVPATTVVSIAVFATGTNAHFEANGLFHGPVSVEVGKMHQRLFGGTEDPVDLSDVLPVTVDEDAAEGRGGSGEGHQQAAFVTLSLYGAIEHAIISGSTRFRGPFQGAGG